jgi:hypothetical protein
MFNIRDDIFFPAVAAFLISPIFITFHIVRKISSQRGDE